jgi:hypothetical protein
MPNKYTQPPRENKNAAVSPRSGLTGKIELIIERFLSDFYRVVLVSEASFVWLRASRRNTTFDIAHETLTF